ncbi:MAG: hypothetical protein DRI75_09165 [Bacteroidetes bacterium]|nr:MAG: hypothetical protein DRI75_09165 [Bacteroidota bacterium]
MKILHITTKSKGGAGIAALRLHKALRQSGVSSAYLSTDLSIDFDGNTIEDPFFSYKKPSFSEKVFSKIQMLLSPTSFQKAKKNLVKLDKQLDYEMISLPYSQFDLHKHKWVQEADIINLHWVCGILNYNSFFNVCKKPIVWTLHDMNPFLGLFHYNGDEKINLHLLNEFDNNIKKLKASAIKLINIGAIVAPSRWLLEEAIKSKVFETFRAKEIISNAIDLIKFKPQDKIELRIKKSIPLNSFVLLFVSGTIDCHRKGLDLLLKALSQLNHLPITIITVGKGQIMRTIRSIKIIPLGKVDTATEMATWFALADVLILPSREDNLPNTMLESFACGTPVISFKTGGMKEHIIENITGSIAEEITAASLAKNIEHFYTSKDNYNRNKIREYAEINFSFNKQEESYKKVYQNLLKESI